MKKKALAILLSILMLTSVTLPGTWATDETEFPEDTTEVTEVAEPEPETETEAETEAESEPEETEAEPEPETDAPEETDVPDESETEEETETETETEPESETETESEAEAEIFDPYAAVEYLYTLDSNEAIIAYLQSLTEDELAAVQAVLEDWGMWADIAAMLYPAEAPEEAPAEAPEGMPPEDWGSTSLEGAVPFTNAVSMFSLIPREASGNDSGVVLNKTVAEDGDGFKITLEAYATGEQTTVSHYDPADIVLVLDISGSMNYGMTKDDYEAVYESELDDSKAYMVNQNGTYRVVRKSGKYWWLVNDDNSWGDKQTPKTDPTDRNNVQFYAIKAGQSKLDYLKTAVNSFISSSLATSPNSQIALVSFSGKVDGPTPPKVTTVSEFSNNGSALQTAVNGLVANGATFSNYGMQEAVTLLQDLNNNRKKVVIMFTDGAPSEKNDFSESVANGAIEASYGLKQAGVTVYTIGVFEGANGDLSSANGTDNTNKYMHYVSSNYPNATSMTRPGSVNGELNGKSYYLSATNSSELLNIFQLISSQVGGATNTTLDTSTVVKDIIAPSFAVPANASDIKLYTAKCDGYNDGLTFDVKQDAPNTVTATINQETATLDVTGFDFSANWCGSHSGTYSGKKLIIEFTVSPKEGFLGGNDVPTNGDTSGMYLNGTKVALFDVPTVNVPIKDITITAKDKNVYLTQVPTEEQLKTDVTIECGTVDITDPSKLDDWQKAYVNLESSFTTSDGFNAIQDGTYTVTASVSPKTGGDSTKPGTVATVKSKTETKNINVFKPELTYQDSEVYNGDNEPAYANTNHVSTVWKHNETPATADIMTDTAAPTLIFEYKPDSAQISSGKINATSDKIGVEVTVMIGTEDVTSHVKFNHATCTLVTKCPDLTDSYKFWLHILSTSLTIKKQFTNDTEYDANEKFVFTVNGGGVSDLKVTVKANGSVTINNLKVGATYTVTEDTTWGWRYDSAFTVDKKETSSITLTADDEENVIVCTNTLKNEKYLTGDAFADNQWNGANGEYTKTSSKNDSSSTDEVTPAPTAFSFSNRTVVNNNTAASQNDATAAATEAPKKKSIFSIFFGSGNKG